MNFNSKLPNQVLSNVFLLLLGIILLIRFASIWLMGPMPQDAYYFFYAQHPALSYFDHPPAIAYLLKIFTGIFGKNVFAIKLADSFITIITSIAVYKLSLRFFSENESKKAIVLFLSTLMVSILSLVSTPDTPLLLFWTLSLISLYEAVFNSRKVYWIVAGILMGLAFDSKYTAVFLPFGMLLFLLLSGSKCKLLLTFWPWLTCLIFVLVASPVIIWNVENHFASFAFQGSQRIKAAAALEFKPRYVFGLIGHQVALLIPVGLCAVLYSVYAVIKANGNKWKNLSAKTIFLLSFFLPLFLVFLMLSPIYWIKINWMMPAYITGIILAGSVINRKWLNVQVAISFAVHLGLLVEIVFYPFPIRSDDTWIGWKQLADDTKEIALRHKADFVFSADGYKTAAQLNLYSDKFIYGQNVVGQNALQFDFIGTDLQQLTGKSAIFLDSDPRFKDDRKQVSPSVALLTFFKSIQQLKPIMIKYHGNAVRKFYVYLCKGYKPPVSKLISG